MTKPRKPTPANLSDAQKAKLRADILVAFPALRQYEDEVAFMVEEYSKDRDFVANLCKRAANPCETLVAEAAAANGAITTLSPGDPGYDEATARMDKARADCMARQEEIARLAELEQAERAAKVISPPGIEAA